MSRRLVAIWTIVVMAVLLVVIGTGYSIVSQQSAVSTLTTSVESQGAKATGAPAAAPEGGSRGAASFGAAAPAGSAAVPNAKGTASSGQPASVTQLIVVTASMDMRVKDVLRTIDAIRAVTAAAGGRVSDLTVQSGVDEPPTPQPLTSGSTASATGPSGASLTLRIPSARLDAVQQRVAALGDVVSQSSSESDVTEQHVDMAARLKNLRAEEVRLRDLLRRAGGVSDLLEVERELSRVRGEIESMQAQLAYLENQAALATLTITLAQPGALVRPAAATWGIADAFTAGVQAAASVVRALVTGSVALSPVAVLVLLGWGVWRMVARSRKASMTDPHEDDPDTQS